MNKCLTIGSGCFLVFPFCFLSKKAPESRVSNFLPRTCETQTSHPLEKYRSDWLAPQVTSHHADSRQCGGWKTAWQKKNQNNKLKCHPPKKEKRWKIQRPNGEQRVCGARTQRLFEAIVFLFEISVGRWPSTPTALHFHFQLRREMRKFLLPRRTPNVRGKTASLDCF